MLGEKTCESRFKALHGTQLTALVGRRTRSTCCSTAGVWRRAARVRSSALWRAGNRKVTAGAGAAAATRSRRRASAHDLPRLSRTHRQRPSSRYRSTGVCRGFSPRDDPLQKLAKLEALLQRDVQDLFRVRPLFASLLALPTDERCPPLGPDTGAAEARRRSRPWRAISRRARRDCRFCCSSRIFIGPIPRRSNFSVCFVERIAICRAGGPHLPARFRSALDTPRPRHPAQPQSPRPARRGGFGGAGRWRQTSAGRSR